MDEKPTEEGKLSERILERLRTIKEIEQFMGRRVKEIKFLEPSSRVIPIKIVFMD